MTLRARATCLWLLPIALATACAPAADAPAATETAQQRDARMSWWREARFGLFIHWGLYAVPAGYHRGRRIGGIGEWLMNTGKIPVAEYREYAQQFNPTAYDPDAWAALAKAAGMKYLVITSKHHDGFALFSSAASDWNVVKATPYGKDLLRPLAEACRKHGLKLGFYYSQCQDWSNPGGAAMGGHWDKAQDGDYDAYLRNVAVPQVREILSSYGPVSVLWWDTPVNMTRERAALFTPLLQLQPGLIQNNRLGGGVRGDTETPEQFIPPTGYPGRDWETCMTLNDTWGYRKDDQRWKPVTTLVRNLVDIASKGGNYLLNVGPTAEGIIPEPSVERLRAVGAWLQVNGEGIYGTSAGGIKRLPWGRCTRRSTEAGVRLYFHVFEAPAGGRLLVPGLRTPIQRAWLLADANRTPLRCATDGDGQVLALPAKLPDPLSSTVVADLATEPVIEPPLAVQSADGNLSLRAVDAVVHGQQLQYESGHGKDNLGYWMSADDWAEWPFKAVRPGRYTVVVEVATVAESRFEVVIGDQRLTAKVPRTGDWARFRTVELGTIEITAAGRTALQVKPVRQGWQPVNLKSVRLVPAS